MRVQRRVYQCAHAPTRRQLANRKGARLNATQVTNKASQVDRITSSWLAHGQAVFTEYRLFTEASNLLRNRS